MWIGDVEQFNAVADERRRRTGPGHVDVVNAYVSDVPADPLKKTVLGGVIVGQDIDQPVADLSKVWGGFFVDCCALCDVCVTCQLTYVLHSAVFGICDTFHCYSATLHRHEIVGW